jgi:hypothetical protein
MVNTYLTAFTHDIRIKEKRVHLFDKIQKKYFRVMMEKREPTLQLKDLSHILCLIFGQWFGLNTLLPL